MGYIKFVRKSVDNVKEKDMDGTTTKYGKLVSKGADTKG